MPTYDATAGTLNLAVVRGDDFSALIDFSIDVSEFSITASMYSLVTFATAAAFTVTVPSPADGQVNIALTDTQTAALAHGTYGWTLTWLEGSATRTALTGYVEVV